MLTFEFITFSCVNKYSFFFFFKPFKHVKIFLTCGLCKIRCWKYMAHGFSYGLQFLIISLGNGKWFA